MAIETRHTLTEREVTDLAVSALGLSIGAAILFFSGDDPMDFLLSVRVVPAVVAAAAVVVISFIPHEMAHRVTARSMDAYSEYEAWRPGVALAVLSGFLGFLFAAPGGTKMYVRTPERFGLSVPELTVKMMGYISIVGPLINISLAVVFAFLADVTNVMLYGVDILLMAARVNTFIALSNLLPFYPLDGYKILRWRSGIWLFTVMLALFTYIIPTV